MLILLEKCYLFFPIDTGTILVLVFKNTFGFYYSFLLLYNNLGFFKHKFLKLLKFKFTLLTCSSFHQEAISGGCKLLGPPSVCKGASLQWRHVFPVHRQPEEIIKRASPESRQRQGRAAAGWNGEPGTHFSVVNFPGKGTLKVVERMREPSAWRVRPRACLCLCG